MARPKSGPAENMNKADKNRADNGRIVIGAITSPHGVRGQFKVKSFTSDPAAVADYGPVHLPNGQELELKIRGQAKGLLICSAPTITTRNQVEDVQGSELSVLRTQLPEAESDEIYQTDLIGLLAIDADGALIGTICGFHDFGAGDLIEIKPAKGQSFFTPFGGVYLGDIELAAGTVEIFVPAGLRGDESEA